MNRNICVYLDYLTPHDEAVLTACAQEHGFEMAFFSKSQRDQAVAYLQTAEILFANSPNLLKQSSNSLQWFACPFAGVEIYCNNPELFFKNPNAILTNCSGAYGVTIGEHLVMTTLMLLRKTPMYMADATAHRWGKSVPIRSIRGSRITIVGTGDIGSTYATHVKAMGASQVTGLSRSGKSNCAAFDTMATIDQLDSILPQTDVLVLAVPNTPQTVNLMTRERLAMLPQSAYLLNVGRGNVLDQAALMEALNTGTLSGAALDVMVPEPLPADHPLWETKNLILTPHISGNMSLGYTAEKTISIFCENLALYAQGLPLNHVVDLARGY